jgi:hypothetical protein
MIYRVTVVSKEIKIIFVLHTNHYFSNKLYTVTDSVVYNGDVALYTFKVPCFVTTKLFTMCLFHFIFCQGL